MGFEKLAEKLIQEAIEKGEFDNLPGRGKPIDLTAYFAMPEEVRLGYSVLKNARIVPPEAQLLKEVGELHDRIHACTDEAERVRLKKELAAKTLKLNLLLELNKRKSARR